MFFHHLKSDIQKVVINMSNRGRNGSNFLGALLLAGLSAGAALLFAPKSGKELRKDLKVKADEYKEQGKTYADNLAQDIKDAVQEVESQAHQEKESLKADLEQDEYTLNQKVAYTQDGEVTAVDQVSGNVAGTSYDAKKGTIDANRPGGQADQLVTEDGEVTFKDRAHGNITGTKFDAGRNETIPADELDEALKDADVEEK